MWLVGRGTGSPRDRTTTGTSRRGSSRHTPAQPLDRTQRCGRVISNRQARSLLRHIRLHYFFTLHRSNTTQPVTARQSVSASEIIVRAATRVARDARGEASQEQSSAGGQSWGLCVVVGVSFRRRVVSCPPALPTPAVDAQAPSTPTGHEPGGLEGCHRLCSSSCMHARCARHAAAPASLARSLHGTACPLPRVVSPRACVAFPAGHHKHRFRGQPGTHTQPTRPR